MNSSFSISEALSYGWETFKKHWKFLVPYFLIILIIQFVFSYFGGEKSPLGSGAILISIISLFVSIFISASIYKTMLMIYSNEKVSLSKNIFTTTRKETWKFFKVAFCVGLFYLPIFFTFPLIITLFFGGASISIMIILLLVLVYILFISIIFGYALYISLDTSYKVIETVKYSFKITKGNVGKIFAFMIASGFVILLGLICLGIGLLVAIPVVSLAQVYVYKKLDAAYQAKNGVAPVAPHTDVVPAPSAIDAAPTTVEIQPEEIVAPKVETKE
jgi:uncharacterized membrane protein